MGGSGGSIRLIVLSRGIVSRAAALLPTGEEEEKSETPLTPMSRNVCAVGAVAEVLDVACDALPATIRTTVRALRGRGSGDAFAAVSWSRYDDLHRASERRTGRFLVWDLRPGCPEFQSGVGAGFEPATDRLGICCSNRLSYPEVGVPESNRRPAAMPLLSRTELTPSRNIFPGIGHAPRQRRAHRMDRCLKTRIHTAGHRSIDASHCRLSPTGNSCARRFSSCPVATRVEHRDAALACLMAEFRDCATRHGPQCPDVRRRMLRNRLLEPGACRKTAARNRSRANHRARFKKTLFANAEKEKPPDGNPRAFAFLGDRGDRSPVKRISRGVCRCRAAGGVCCRTYRSRSSAHMHPHRDGSARVRAGWRRGRRVSSEYSGKQRDWRQHGCDGGESYTRLLPIANIFFTFFRAADERQVRTCGRSCASLAACGVFKIKTGRPESPCV